MSHEARSNDTADILAQVGDTMTQRASPESEAAAALARMREMSADLRGCAILAADGRVLAASGEADRWRAAAEEFLAAADSSRGEPVARVHVARSEEHTSELQSLRH